MRQKKYRRKEKQRKQSKKTINRRKMSKKKKKKMMKNEVLYSDNPPFTQTLVSFSALHLPDPSITTGKNYFGQSVNAHPSQKPQPAGFE